MTEIDAHEETPRYCRCGQDLEPCEREHCPRCGCEVGKVGKALAGV